MCETCGCRSQKACDPKGHQSHLCELMAKKTPVNDLKKYVMNSQYICQKCGRTAAQEINLCAPEKI
jgi:hypothetical protein